MNNKMNVDTRIMLNDKDYITRLLTCLKDIEKNYVIAMTEASCEWLYDEFKNIFDVIALLQRDVYELMYRYGWYQMKEVDEDKIYLKLEMLKQEYNELEI